MADHYHREAGENLFARREGGNLGGRLRHAGASSMGRRNPHGGETCWRGTGAAPVGIDQIFSILTTPREPAPAAGMCRPDSGLRTKP